MKRALLALPASFLLLAVVMAVPQQTPVPKPPAGKFMDATPVTTYAKSCASCHGVEGAKYGMSFKNITERRLRNMTRNMLQQQKVELPEDQYWAMVAYLRSVRNDVPFVIWNGANSVQASLKADIKVEPKGTATKTGPGTWEIKGFEAANATLVATVGDKITRLKLSEAPYSGTTPIAGR